MSKSARKKIKTRLLLVSVKEFGSETQFALDFSLIPQFQCGGPDALCAPVPFAFPFLSTLSSLDANFFLFLMNFLLRHHSKPDRNILLILAAKIGDHCSREYSTSGIL